MPEALYVYVDFPSTPRSQPLRHSIPPYSITAKLSGEISSRTSSDNYWPTPFNNFRFIPATKFQLRVIRKPVFRTPILPTLQFEPTNLLSRVSDACTEHIDIFITRRRVHAVTASRVHARRGFVRGEGNGQAPASRFEECHRYISLWWTCWSTRGSEDRSLGRSGAETGTTCQVGKDMGQERYIGHFGKSQQSGRQRF